MHLKHLMKKTMTIRSNHNDLLNYFIHDERDLSPAYVRKCKKFLEKIKQKNKAASSQAGGPSHKESGFKQPG